MKKLLLFFVVCSCVFSYGQTIESAMGVVQRRIPGIAANVTFESIPDSMGYDVFEVQASGGKVTVKGSSAVAMCHGLYNYLKQDCKCLITWEGDQLNLPNPLPATPLRRVVSSVLYKQYFNVVTFGYSTAFWDWNRWEKEIDWMALHGINMPLAMSGQEKIWQQVWKSYGCTDANLNAFFTGPAFLAWNRMGNVYGKEGCLSMVNGSLPQSFIDNDAELQKKILARESELGMKPIIPGFSGFIPRAIKTLYPSVRTWIPTAWNNATPSTLALHPLDTMFSSVTKKFITLYKQYYGDVTNFYLIDLFNEIDPPAGTTLTDLGIISKGAYNSLINADPNATWVIQGWCFSYQSYWRNSSNTSAFLDSVPNNKMIVLDLNADADEIFRLHPNSIGKKRFIWDMLGNNWGQHTQLSGNLDLLSTKPIKALNDANKTETHMVGMGMTDEGIEHNSVCFELMTDNMWRKSSVNLPNWIAAWAQQRYGSTDPVVANIWNQMYNLFYKNANDPTAPYQVIPNIANVSKGTNNQSIRNLIQTMLAAPESIRKNILFQRDLVDVAKRYVGDNIQTSIWKVVTALRYKDVKVAGYRAEFDSLMLGLDALLGTQPPHRLSNWIQSARNFVAPADQDLLEQNARLQVTTWVAPSWQGYARKEWSGLVGDFYRGKWNEFFNAIAAGSFNQGTFNNTIYNWSNAWCNKTTLYHTYACQVVPQTKYLLMLVDKMMCSLPTDSLGIGYKKPVTATNTEGSNVASSITDGSTTGSFWSGSGYPQSATVDLQAVSTINLFKVYPYVDGSRYYKYKIEVSTDNTNWSNVVDMTNNTKVSTTVGFKHSIAPVQARYVRITMTYNSANTSVHLYELKIFGQDSLGIAYNMPVTATSFENNDAAYDPSHITDGTTTGTFWSATPAPQTATIDLQNPDTITMVKVYPYYDGSRYYQYKVEGSTDNQNWFMLADMTANTSPGSTYGFKHLINSLVARYIRITMTHNSANPGLHLYEVRVFGTGNEQLNHQPCISDGSFVVSKGSKAGTFIGKVVATDPDANQSLKYTLTDADPVNVIRLSHDSLFVNDLSLSDMSDKAWLFIRVDDSGKPKMANYARYAVKMQKVEQNISFDPLPNVSGSVAYVVASASASSGLKVTFTSSNPAVASISNDTIFIHASGIVTITATQAGNAIYSAATDLSQTLNVTMVSGINAIFNTFQLYPNPVKDKLTLIIPTNYSVVNISNMENQYYSVGTVQTNGKQTILPLPTLNAGIYFLHLRDNNGVEVVLRFIKK